MLTAIVNALQFPVVVQFAQNNPLVIPRATMPRFGTTILFGFSN